MHKRANEFPPGWDRARVMKVIEHYESQTDEEAAAEDDAAFAAGTHTTMDIPVELVPEVRDLIARNARKPAPRRKAARHPSPARRRSRA